MRSLSISHACLGAVVLAGLMLVNNPAQQPEPRPPAPTSPDPAAPPLQRPVPQPRRPESRLIDVLDANRDGVIDAEEIANASAALEALDKNDDGELTEDEYLSVRRFVPQGRRRAPPFGFRRRPLAPLAPKGGIDNFGIVDEHLLRGAQPSVAAIPTLKALGVTTIIDLKVPDASDEAEKLEAERNGIIYTNLPMESLARPTTNQISAILSTITNAPGKVFVHCRAGKDRTGTVVACYRISHDQWPSDRALREADEYRLAAELTWMREFVSEWGRDKSPAPPSP